MPNNPLTEQELYDYGILRSLTPPGYTGLSSYFPAGYFLVPPHDVNGPVLWRKFNAGYISEGIIDPNRLGTGVVGDGNLYLADDGTWKPVSSGGGSQNLQQVTDLGNTTTNTIDTAGTKSDYFLLDTTATPTLQPGMFGWNDAFGTADLRLKGNNVTLQVGQEILARVVNKTGADLLESEYKVVRVRIASEGGAQGQRLAVVLAQGDNDPDSVTTLGIVTETILDNQEGFITILGNVSNIDTTGTLQGETWVDGDVLYLSPTTPGGLTKVKPQAPQHTLIVGYVVYAHANQGKIFVKVDNGYELDELHNVLITSPASGQLLRYNGSVWYNWTPDFLTSVPTLAQVTTAGNTTTNAITVGNTTINGTYFQNAGSSIPIIVKTSNIEVAQYFGTALYAGFRVVARNIDGVPYVGLNTSNSISTNGVGTQRAFFAYWGDTANYTSLGYGNNTNVIAFSNATGNVVINTGTTFTDSGYKLDVNGTARVSGNLTVDTNTLFVDAANNRVGIGTTTPEVQLHVLSSSNPIFIVENAGAQWLRFSAGAVGSAMKFSNTGNFAIGPVATKTDINLINTFVVFGSTGNIGINTTTDSGYKLDVNGNTAVRGSLLVTDTSGTLRTAISGFDSNEIAFRGTRWAPDAGTLSYSDGQLTLLGGNRTLAGNQDIIITNVNGNVPNTYITLKGQGASVVYSNRTRDIVLVTMSTTIPSGSSNISYNSLNISPNVNYAGVTGSSNFRGLYYNPTLTGFVGEHEAIRTTSGKVIHQGLTNATQPDAVYYDTTTGELTYGALPTFTETDPIFTASPSFGITSTQISNWDTAYGWGNHATVGYLTAESDTLDSVTGRGNTTANPITVSSSITIKANNPFTFAIGNNNINNPTASGNTYIFGNNILPNVLISTETFAFGDSALNESAYSSYNIAIGTGAGRKVQKSATDIYQGGANVLIGVDSGGQLDLGSQNLFIGRLSGYYINSSNNIAIGARSGGGDPDLLTQGFNIYLGHSSGKRSTGGDNIFIGYESGLDSTKSNWFILGNRNNAGLIEGNFSTGNVLIGTNTDNGTNRLQVNGSISATGGNSTQWNEAYSWGDHSTAGYLTSFTEADTLDSVTSRGNTTINTITVGGLVVDTDTLFVDSTNNRVGIRTTTPGYNLDVLGSSRVQNYGSSTFVVQETQNNNAVWIRTQWYGSDQSLYFNSTDFSIKYNNTIGAFGYGAIINMKSNGNVQIGGVQDNGFKLEVSGSFRSTGAAQVATSTGGLGVGTTSPGYKLDVNGNGRFVGDLFANSALTVGGLLTSSAGKIGVQGGVDGGNSRGIFLYTTSDFNWGIYMATSGASKSLSGGTAPAGLEGRTGQAVRFRAYYSDTTAFIWESNNQFGGPNDYALMSLTGNTGSLTTRGSVTSNSFIKSGGTSSQFLKADGSVDSSVYATTTSLTTLESDLGAWKWRWRRWASTVNPAANTAEAWTNYYNTYFVNRTAATDAAYPLQDSGYVDTRTQVGSEGGFGGSSYGNIFGNLAYYHALISTNILVEQEFTVNVTDFSGDDAHALFINGVFVRGNTGCCTNISYSYTFTPGWYRIDLIYTEGVGGDYIRMGWNPKDYLSYISVVNSNYSDTNFKYITNQLVTSNITVNNLTVTQAITSNSITTSTLNATGRVGVGTTTPEYAQLQVERAFENFSSFNNTPNSADNFIQRSVFRIDQGTQAMYFGMASPVNDRRGYIQMSHESTAYANATGSIALNPFGGNIGIGTFSPESTLHVVKTGTLDVQTIVVTLASNSRRPVLQFSEELTGTSGVGMSLEYDGRSSGNDNKFYINSTSSSPLFTVTNGGNVGIGTTTPAQKLHVNGNIHIGNTTSDDNLDYFIKTAGQLNIEANSATTQDNNFVGLFLKSGVGANIGAIRIYGSASDTFRHIEFSTLNTERMRITKDGYIGIGTTSPQKHLHVAGDMFIKGSASTTATKIFEVQNSNGTSIMDFRGDTYAFFGCGQGGGSASGFIFRYSDTSGTQFTGYNYGNGTSPSYKPILMDTDVVGRSQGIYINYGAPGQSNPAPISDTEFAVRGRGTSTLFTARFADNNSNPLLYIRDNGVVTIGTETDNGLGKLQVEGDISANNYTAGGQVGLTISVPTGAGQTLNFTGGILTSVT